MKNWNNNKEITVAVSRGGVIALSNPYDNLISTGIFPWPPAEIVQKLHQSRQSRAYVDDQKGKSIKFLGYYSDLQSIHSEDAITWSVFGTVAHSNSELRNLFIQDFFNKIGILTPNIKHSEIFLWRRIPHPDTLVSGGPEIDFGIYTGKTLVLGEAKWQSSVNSTQGKNRDKSQIQLRIEFLNKYGKKLYPDTEKFAVAGIGLRNDVVNPHEDGIVQCVGTRWEEICDIDSHPLADEIKRYLTWKIENSKLKG